jgi:hypothetical protein
MKSTRNNADLDINISILAKTKKGSANVEDP